MKEGAPPLVVKHALLALVNLATLEPHRVLMRRGRTVTILAKHLRHRGQWYHIFREFQGTFREHSGNI
jgi:hypothetical protein